VVLGAQTELALRSTAERSERIQHQVDELVHAVDRELATRQVLRGHGGGNGGLFTGILARYLALVANRLPVTTQAGRRAAGTAAELVRQSAAAAWEHRATVDGLPLFGPDWTTTAHVPHSTRPGRQTPDGAEESAQPERDLSVQLGGWMLMEAAATLPTG
jgi:predicted alpha-1,6-mannanase (GH76 family)